MEVLAQLAQCDNTQDAFLDELENVAKELATTASQRADVLEEARHEQTETRMDLQKVGQMVEMAQKMDIHFPRCDICLESRRGSP
ncbi:MAG: hypothetical protein AB2556_17745 [Candidatus Thiodiazotropha sp.]